MYMILRACTQPVAHAHEEAHTTALLLPRLLLLLLLLLLQYTYCAKLRLNNVCARYHELLAKRHPT